MQSIVISNWEIIWRLLAAVILGALVGVERSLAGKTAGMRTYALVSMGSALFIIISELVIGRYLALGIRALDPLRVASQVIIGIGFLGAGLMVFRNKHVSGLTTAAGVWVSSGIGMAMGYGFYTLGFFVAILTVLIFTVFWSLEEKVAGDRAQIRSGHDDKA